MSTIVLVHGALQTSATWDLVAPRLRRLGHEVFTPELSGMGPRGGPMTAGISLDTHIANLVGFIKRHDLQCVVLVGHSYAGMVTTGVATHCASRLDHLVYVDAFVPEQGQSAFDFMPPHIRDGFVARVAADGFSIVPDEALLDLWHLEGEARTFVRERWWNFSLRCFEQPLREDCRALTVRRTYIACVGPQNGARPVFESFAARAQREHWGYFELPTGHDCHVDAAEAVSAIIHTAATQPMRP
ncbi:alpha/beta hydrolase [Opitutus sp. ER46]|uniref:alpha/beta fold hydrolase n=1 Tax=Opitutus sp. ER46 TaxID=2161864 RepID=UPI000D2FF6C9|nr:alpha/beta hydrolase [Opitutus sp. ER46]PTY00137.1 hypothetical protein DB354_02280 [Opitutus sp. ER46]